MRKLFKTTNIIVSRNRKTCSCFYLISLTDTFSLRGDKRCLRACL